MNTIKDVVEGYKRAVHTQDKERFLNLWSKDKECSLISIVSEYHGVESIFNDFLIGRIQKAYTSIELIQDGDLHINIINDELVVVIFKYHTECIRRDNNEKYGIEGVETQVIIKEDNNWRLLHVHYSK